MDNIEIPGGAVDHEAKDLAGPAAALARTLDLLRDGHALPANDTQTPPSLQVIQAGSLAFSRLWNRVVASGVTVAGLATSIGAVVANLTTSLPDSIGTALVAGGLLVVATGVIAIAIIVAADVRSRAEATVAQMNGRVAIATAIVDAAGKADHPGTPATAIREREANSTNHTLLLALSAFPQALRVSTSGGSHETVTGIRNHESEGLQLRADSGDWIPIGQIKYFQT